MNVSLKIHLICIINYIRNIVYNIFVSLQADLICTSPSWCVTLAILQVKCTNVPLGYWPGSPTNASYFFDHAVFQFWDAMQKNMPGSSSNAFVKTLAQISEKKGRVHGFTFSKEC